METARIWFSATNDHSIQSVRVADGRSHSDNATVASVADRITEGTVPVSRFCLHTDPAR